MLDEIESERFAELVHEHARLVFSIALSILRNRADAEDASQECFLRLIRYRDDHASVAVFEPAFPAIRSKVPS